MSATLALQTALYQHLVATPQLIALLGGPRISDAPPQGEAFPFVTFGSSATTPLNGTDAETDIHTITFQVYSRAHGRKETALILDQLERALDDAELSLVGHRLISIAVTFKELRRDADGETRRGLLRLRASTEPLL